jgi:hypothetical protein
MGIESEASLNPDFVWQGIAQSVHLMELTASMLKEQKARRHSAYFGRSAWELNATQNYRSKFAKKS